MGEPSRLSTWIKWAAEQLRDAESSQQKRATLVVVAAAAGVIGVSAAWVSFRGIFPRKPRVLGVIPARWGSSRFKGKPLAQILGKPLVQRTWENAKLARTLDRVVVATDDDRIGDCCRNFGAEVVITSTTCENGSERAAEAMRIVRGRFDIVVNIQGDEPLLEPEAIDAVVLTLQKHPEAVAATAVADLPSTFAADPNRVKCVVDLSGFALYFSRALIPSNQNGTPCKDFPYMLHLGLQAFHSKFLEQYVKFQRTPLETEEQLEQLRILETGHRISVVKVRHKGHGVDTPADIKRVEEILKQHDLSSDAKR